jgi:hypothetical protein
MIKANETPNKALKKWWNFRYRDSVVMTFLTFGLIGYPMMVMRYNPPPQEAQAEVVRGVILSAQVNRPNLVLREDDGTKVELDFSANLQGVFRGAWPRLSGVSDENLSKLIGCPAEIRIDRLRGFILASNPRIWSIRCDAFSMPYESEVLRYEKSIGISDPIRIGLYLVCLIVVLAYAYVDFKKKD